MRAPRGSVVHRRDGPAAQYLSRWGRLDGWRGLRRGRLIRSHIGATTATANRHQQGDPKGDQRSSLQTKHSCDLQVKKQGPTIASRPGTDHTPVPGYWLRDGLQDPLPRGGQPELDRQFGRVVVGIERRVDFDQIQSLQTARVRHQFQQHVRFTIAQAAPQGGARRGRWPGRTCQDRMTGGGRPGPAR